MNIENQDNLRFNTSSNSHYCTINSSNCADVSHHLDSIRGYCIHNDANNLNMASLNLCEEYPPSYMLRQDQISSYKNNLQKLKLSKKLMRQAMKQIDAILGEDEEPLTAEEKAKKDIKEFFDSKKALSSSLNISSLNHMLPRTDIPKLELKDRKVEEEILFNPNNSLSINNASSIFDFKPPKRSSSQLSNHTIHAKKQNEINRRVISAGYRLNKDPARETSNKKPKSILKK